MGRFGEQGCKTGGVKPYLPHGSPLHLRIRRGTSRDIPGLPVRVRTCLRAPHRQAQTGQRKATRSTWRLSTGYPTLQRRVNLAQFLRYSLNDSSGCKMQRTNPSWSAFFRLARETLLYQPTASPRGFSLAPRPTPCRILYLCSRSGDSDATRTRCSADCPSRRVNL